MIRYALRCEAGHEFESWFQSAAAYDALAAAGRLTCPHCGTRKVEKALMAPSILPARKADTPPPGEALGPLSAPASEIEARIAALRRMVEAESDYVGLNFVAEVRQMHEGLAPARSVYGEARLDEARALLEDGIPVMPLPFVPGRKSN
jgi:hypothetical protein